VQAEASAISKKTAAASNNRIVFFMHSSSYKKSTSEKPLADFFSLFTGNAGGFISLGAPLVQQPLSRLSGTTLP
jgi:hypothetical protein